MTFLSPLGGLAALVALVPLAALLLAWRRSERASRALGLVPAGRGGLVLPGVLAVLACACAGLAAAQPALRLPQRQGIRSQSEILYVVDVSHSMAASRSAGGTTRLAEARGVVTRLRAATADVPSGLGGMTDRVLPYLLPTPDRAVFAATLKSSVLIETPPPREVSVNATSFDSLDSLAGNGWFDPSARWRTCVLVTDGESHSFSPAGVADALNAARCKLVAVRVGSTADRVYDGNVPAAGYAPDPAAASKLASLASATGGVALASSNIGAGISAVHADAEHGAVTNETQRTTKHALAPWLALMALVLAVLVVASRLLTKSHFATQPFRHTIVA